MSINSDLLKILVCPDQRTPLSIATAEVIQALNAKIEASGVSTIGGQPVSEPLEGGLLRADGKVLYPIRAGVPILLVPEGIAL